jgi:23S rRNA (uracil1939-C5)-methyltransferase
MKKNDIINNIEVEKIWYEGIGLGKMPDGKRLIIKWWALPGMICNLRVVRTRKDYAECHVVDIISVDPKLSTGEIKCPHYLYNPNKIEECKSGCGGCKRQIMSYPMQLETKRNIVKDSFRHYPWDLQIEQVLPSPDIWWYRNKIEYSFGKFIKGRWEDKQILSDWSLGFHRQGMFGKIVDIDQCFLVDTKVNTVFKYCKKLFAESWLPVYDQMQHKWIYRHLMIRQAKRMDQMMLILSVSSEFKIQNSKLWIVEKLKADVFLCEHVTTFVIIHNDSLADVVATRDSEFETLRGDWIINEKLVLKVNNLELKTKNLELIFDISPLSFFQTNTSGAELLYSTAIKMSKEALWENFNWTILDLYCGTGTIWLSFLKSGIWNKLIWVEETPSAIEDAKKNAVANGINSDYFFIAWKAEKLMEIKNEELSIKNGELIIGNWELSIVIVDPPRSGLHEDICKLLIELKQGNPELKVCYISCNPVTLARDLNLLSEAYSNDRVQPVDMFPHTYHVENIVILR